MRDNRPDSMTEPTMSSQTTQAIYQYWGKAKRNDDGTTDYHLLIYHCLDVAAVASVWFDQSEFLQKLFSHFDEYDRSRVKAWLMFFIALHDIGKTDLRFQLKIPECLTDFNWNIESEHFLTSRDSRSYNHGAGGAYWIHNELQYILGVEDVFCKNTPSDDIYTFLESTDENLKWEEWKCWLESVCEHHGKRISITDYNMEYPIRFPEQLAVKAKRDRSEFIHTFEKLFLNPVELSLADTIPKCSRLLSGFCSICDWLGSNTTSEHFPLTSYMMNPAEYFESKHSDAEKIISMAGLVSQPRKFIGLKTLLKSGYIPRQLQTKVELLPIKQGLTIVEGPTGSGKTELALAHAWKLIEKNMADSIIFALPTQATANGMLPRLDVLAGILFKEHPNILLAHGNSRFNRNFMEIRNRVHTVQEEEDAAAQCSDWLGQSRKRALLGQIAVCTIDQVLMSVLPVKHSCIRQFCTGRSVLIVDEIHAYDRYMYGLLTEVLRNQKESGGSTILLSATLPGYQKRLLLTAWGGVNYEVGSDYPLITSIMSNETISLNLESKIYPLESDMKTVTVNLEHSTTMLPSEDLLEQILVAVNEGANVAVICNLVDDAQTIYTQLSNMFTGRVCVQLFHSRYSLFDRQGIEEQVLSDYGDSENRTRGKVLVATQVIEQSLNVDFDWIVTQLCPIDLLFQRLGRLHRFNIHNRPSKFKIPSCTILAPTDECDFGLHQYIYRNIRVMWRTLSILENCENKISFPHVYRPWVEQVYKEESWDNEPDRMTVEYEIYKDQYEFIQGMKAKMMIKTGISPFDDDYSNSQLMTRDGDMGILITPFVKINENIVLLSGIRLKDIPDNEHKETVYMNSVTVMRSWWFDLKDECITLSITDDTPWLEMIEKPDGSWERIVGAIAITYSKTLGLGRRMKKNNPH